MRIINIEWNVENMRGILKTLPVEIKIKKNIFEDLLDNTEEELEENIDLVETIAEYLYNQYGWSVYDFNIRTEEQYIREKFEKIGKKKKITKGDLLILEEFIPDKNNYRENYRTNREYYNYLKEMVI